MPSWYKIAEHIEELPWQTNQLCIVEVNGKKITLAKLEKGIVACAHKCPHAGGIMANGYIDVLENIVCPLHRYKFSLQNGRNTSGEGYYIKTHPIEIRADGIFIALTTYF
jgi:nitrite reductase/ring-hydroxylating ferredoxin subunit